MRRWLLTLSVASIMAASGWIETRADEDALEAALQTESTETGAANSPPSGEDQSTPLKELAPSDEGPTAAEPLDLEVEVIRERYPNRQVKIEREVTQDRQGNYLNHGVFRSFDQKGNLTVEGEYRFGKREGIWHRWYRAGEAEALTKAPFNTFQGPFVSEANFKADKIDGKWTIADAKKHRACEIHLVEGQRHGRAVWWFSNGHVMRDATYNHGVVDGQLLEFTADGKVASRDTYQQGRRLAERIDHFPGGAKKTQGMYLFPTETEISPDDWWNCKFAVYSKQGHPEKHGSWTAWHANGQKQAEGTYDHDVQVGMFTWWFENGQKALEGAYEDGEQIDRWVWWHESGQKAIQGEFALGHPSGRWMWWNADGKVSRATEMAQGAGEVVKSLPAPPVARPEAVATPPRATKVR